MNSNCSKLDMRNLQEQVKKAVCYQKLFWPFTVWINCFSHLKNFENSQPSASNFKSFFSWSLEHFFLTVGQNNFGNKTPLCLILNWIHSLNENTVLQDYHKEKYLSQTNKLPIAIKLNWNGFPTVKSCLVCNILKSS